MDDLLDEAHQINSENLLVNDEPLDEQKDYGAVFNANYFGKVSHRPTTLAPVEVTDTQEVRIRVVAVDDGVSREGSLRKAKSELKTLS